MAQRDPTNPLRYVILGGGPAGLSCAENLRAAGFTGEIVVVSRENSLPYDRTLISKDLSNGDPSSWSMRTEEFLEKHEIIYLLNKTVFSVIPEMKNVVCADGDHIQYDKLCVATGSQAIRPKIENIQAINVHFLRSTDIYKLYHTLLPGTYDMKTLQTKLKSGKFNKVVVVGGGFISNEVIANLRKNYPDMDLHMVFSEESPACKLGPEIGEYLYVKHTDNKVTIHD